MKEINMQENGDYEVSLKDYIKVIRRRFWIIISVIGLGIILSLLYVYKAPPRFKSSSTLLVKRIESLFGGAYLTSPIEEEIANHIYLIKTTPVLRKTAESFSERELNEMDFDSTGGAFHRLRSDIRNGKIKIGVEGESRVIKIEVTENNPYRSKLFANNLAESYLEFDVERKRENARSTYNFLAKQTKEVKEQLEESEKKLKEFKEESGILGVSSETNEFLKQMAEIEKQLKEASVEEEVLSKKLSEIKTRLNDREKGLLSEASETSFNVLVDLKSQLTQLENQKANLLISGYSPGGEKIREVETEIKNVKDKMNSVVSDLLQQKGVLDPLEQMKELMQTSLNLTIEHSVAATRREAYEEALKYYDEKLKALPEKQYKLAQLERERESNNKIYMMLLEKKEQAQITEVSERGSISLVELAKLPEEPDFFAKVKKGILFVILGVMLGIGAGFLADFIDSGIRDEEEVVRLTGLPVLGILPRIRTENGSELILKSNSRGSALSEGFKRLRANIKLSRPEGIPNSLLITGVDKGCGKSMVALNIAFSFSHSGENVLLVDTDLRRPAIEDYLGISRVEGLTDLLTGKGEEIELFKHNGVSIIPSGKLPPNPSELLDSERMRSLLKSWEEEYDIVVLDSPPILSVSDSRILASEVEETIIVASYGETSRDMVRKTSEILNRLSIKAMGFVLNKVLHAREYGYYYYYEEY